MAAMRQVQSVHTAIAQHSLDVGLQKASGALVETQDQVHASALLAGVGQYI